MSAIGQIFLKLGVRSPRLASAFDQGGIAALVRGLMSAPFVWLGLATYGVSVLAWLWVLSKVDVSVAYPFVGISFVMTTAMGALFLHENVTLMRIAGTALVVLGCVIVARSAG